MVKTFFLLLTLLHLTLIAHGNQGGLSNEDTRADSSASNNTSTTTLAADNGNSEESSSVPVVNVNDTQAGRNGDTDNVTVDSFNPSTPSTTETGTTTVTPNNNPSDSSRTSTQEENDGVTSEQSETNENSISSAEQQQQQQQQQVESLEEAMATVTTTSDSTSMGIAQMNTDRTQNENETMNSSGVYDNSSMEYQESLDDSNSTTMMSDKDQEENLVVGDGGLSDTKNGTDQDNDAIGLQEQIYIVAGTLAGIIFFLILLVLALALSVASMKKQLAKPQQRYIPDQPTPPRQETIHAYDNSAYNSGQHEMQERRVDAKPDLERLGYQVYNGKQQENRYSRDSRQMMRVEDSVAPYNNDNNSRTNDNRRSGGYRY